MRLKTAPNGMAAPSPKVEDFFVAWKEGAQLFKHDCSQIPSTCRHDCWYLLLLVCLFLLKSVAGRTWSVLIVGPISAI